MTDAYRRIAKKEFSHTIHALKVLRRRGQRDTKKYRDLLERANEINPNPHTPIGFYLED